MTIDEALNKGASLLVYEQTPRHIAELLICHVLGKGKEWVIAHGDKELPLEDLIKFEEFIMSL